MKFTKWRIAPEHPEAQARLTAAGYPYLVSAVLAGRGVETPEQAAAFLEREQSLTYSPNGRFMLLCGDGEYAISTTRVLRSKCYGAALEAVWSAEGNGDYAVKEVRGESER